MVIKRSFFHHTGRLLCQAFMFLLIHFLIVHCALADERTVKIGVYENAPKVFTSESGQPSGIFIDIIEYIAEREDWNIQYRSGTFREGLERLSRGEIDLMPDVAYTADRAQIYSFHKVPVLSSWSQVYTSKGSSIRSLPDLNGKRIAVLESSIQQETLNRLLSDFGINTTLIPMGDFGSIFDMVANNRADAAVTNRFYGLMHAREKGLEETGVVFDPSELYYAAFSDSSGPLLEIIDLYLDQLKKDQSSPYYESMKRWTSEEIQFTLPVWVKLTGLTAAIILLVSIAGSLFLKQQVIHRTREIREMNGVLIESEKKYRDLVMLANTIILRWSHDGKITFLNEFGLKFFEYSEEEILGQHVTVIFPEEEEAGLKLDRFLNESRDSPQKFERKILQNIRRNGKRVWIDWTNRVIFDDHGQIKEVLSIGSDITARKKAEDEIHRLNADLRKYADNLEMRVKERTAQLASAKEQAESADRLKSAFLATMSHELRTPLNSIIGFTGILLQELAGPLNPEQKKQLGMVQNSSRHLLALINDVLDISKIEAGQMDLSPGPFELGESIDKMVGLVSPLAEKKGLNLKVEIAENVGTVINDQRRLEQVILNLLNNAVKFTDSGYVHVSCLLEHGRYILTVSDTGTGIHQEEIPGLFQPFHQIDTGLSRRHEGTGLGLSICRKLLEMMGGSIEVKSEFGKGSSFTIIFPVETGGLI